MRFTDRTEAGRPLAGMLEHLRGQDVVGLAVPRCGAPAGAEVAKALGTPLDTVAEVAHGWSPGQLASSARPSA